MKPSVLPGGRLSCWGSISLLGVASIDKLLRGSSHEPEQESWEKGTKIGAGRAYFSSLHEVKRLKWSMCVLEKIAVFVVIIIILPSSASAQGHSLHPFWWIADRAQCCVKTDKQHLQQWQPGTPSVPHSPAKSASVLSHLLRPSYPLLLPCCFYCCCLQGDPSFIWTVDLAQARLVRRCAFTWMELSWLQCETQ